MDEHSPSGVDAEAVTRWLAERVPTMTKPLTFDLIAGGRSNLTYSVTDAERRRWVLRRPPTGHVLASAHDMGREHRIMHALADSTVPVPGLVGLCDDETVTGAQFYVMDFVDGTVVRDRAAAARFDEPTRGRMGTSLVETLATLHAVDPDHVGLGDLGKREDYLARQLRRWIRQIDNGAERDLPALRRVHADLESRMPTQRYTGIVHGDYRLDNAMVTTDGDIAAVLDWELCTLGDTMADLGGLVLYWGEHDRDDQPLVDAPTLADGFQTGIEAAEIYATASGRDISELPYYIAFAAWRLACIIEGVYTRFKNNAMGDQELDPEIFALQVDALVERAGQSVAELS